MGVFNDARLRAGAMLREWKEKRAEKRATRPHAADQLHGHSRFFLLNVPMTATVCAAFVEIYWAILFCIEATGRLDANIDFSLAYNEPLRFIWDFAFSGHLPVLLGLVAATAPIVMISMVWLPVQFAMRGFGRWRRGSLIAVGLLANALVIVSGTVVMNHNRQEQVRDDLVIEQSADQQRAALVAQRDAIEARWETLTEPTNTTLQAQAARAGVAGWDAYIATARRQLEAGTISQQRFDLIERARGSAIAAETYQGQMDALTGQIAASAPEAATAAVVVDEVGAELNGFAQAVEVWRPPFVALIATLIGVLGSWWTLAMLEGMNPRDVLRSGWAPEELRIEDKRDEAPITAQPMKPPREVVTDAETGEELVKVKPREYWRKRKGQPQKFAIEPEMPPDEKGVSKDGGARIGQSVAGALDVAAIVAQGAGDSTQPVANADEANADSKADAQESQPVVQPEPPTELDLSETTLDDLPSFDGEADDPKPNDSVEQDNAERDDVEPRGLLPAA